MGAPEVDEAAAAQGGEAHARGLRPLVEAPVARGAAGRGSARPARALWVTRTRMSARGRAGRRAGRPPTSADAASRLPVGSSQSRRRGPEHEGAGQGHALPLAARQLGRPVVEPVAEARPRESSSRARASRSAGAGTPPPARPAWARARSRAREHCGSRQWSWKTKPTSRLRKAASSASARAKGLRAEEDTVPEVGGSSAPRMFRSVLLPLPEGPITQSDSPGARSEGHPGQDGERPARRLVALGDVLDLEQRRTPFRPARAWAAGRAAHR